MTIERMYTTTKKLSSYLLLHFVTGCSLFVQIVTRDIPLLLLCRLSYQVQRIHVQKSNKM